MKKLSVLIAKKNNMTKFRQFLEKEGVKMEELAYATGLSFSMTYKIVQGYSDTSLKTARKMMRALDCKFDDIFEY